MDLDIGESHRIRLVAWWIAQGDRSKSIHNELWGTQHVANERRVVRVKQRRRKVLERVHGVVVWRRAIVVSLICGRGPVQRGSQPSGGKQIEPIGKY